MEKKKQTNAKNIKKRQKNMPKIKHEKSTSKQSNLISLILQNKIKIISSISALLAIILIAIIAINHGKNVASSIDSINPELAKAKTYSEVKEEENAVEGTENVKFDAYFSRDINGDAEEEKIRGTSKKIGEEDTLYIELEVGNTGALKDATIEINAENFYFQTAILKDNIITENYIGNNTKQIKLNTISEATTKEITGQIRSGDYTNSTKISEAIGNNINNYSKVNSITLTGKYDDGTGKEIEISKTVNFNIDWYGTTEANLVTTTQKKNIEEMIDKEESTINIEFTVNTEEIEKQLILSKNHVEGQIPTLGGYAPIEVTYTGSNAVFYYDSSKMTFSIDREISLDEEGNVISGIPTNNNYEIRVVYPLEAYEELGKETFEYKIPFNTYFEGANNPSEEFVNPYKSKTKSGTIILECEKEIEDINNTNFEITVGKKVYDPEERYIVTKEKALKTYNGTREEGNDTYIVTWKGYIGANQKLDGITMKETQEGQEQVADQFIKTDSSEEKAEEVISNTGIYFTGLDSLLGEEGWIKIYDEDTGKLLVTFTQNDWNNYNANNPYNYEMPVKHIRVETSKILKNGSNIYVYNVKEIDKDKIESKYTKEEFNNFKYIKSTLVGYVAGEYIETVTNQANYEAPISIANIKLSNNTISTQKIEKNEKIMIEAYAKETANQAKWQNGTFLVKLPEEIIEAKINSIIINNPRVEIENYGIIKQNGNNFIKITTNNITPQTYLLTIDVDLTVNPKTETQTKAIELYATNENISEYYNKAQDIYDVNNNLNTEEQINYSTVDLNIITPNSLITNQIAKNFDEKGTEVISPEIADIKPTYIVEGEEQKEQTADIEIQIKNNYKNTISEAKILGKIPFKGNTSILTNEDLGSTFTTKMKETGITLPEELKEIATVYYSENENADKDLSKVENNWKQSDQVEDWSKIKTYLIDLQEYVIPVGKELKFNYTIEIPKGIELNEISYSQHGIYYCIDTETGKNQTETESNKLGIKIAEKYDIELTKYQKGKEKVIPGATYNITEIVNGTKGENKTAVTNNEGKLTIKNIYAGKVYEIKEISSPNNYELNEDTIRIIGNLDEKGNLKIEKQTGKTRGEITVTKEENYKANIQVEDKVKANLKITKIEKGTENKIAGVRFKITEQNIQDIAKTVTTDANGEIKINGLTIGKEYTLQEEKAEGYYLANPIKFKIIENEGKYELQTIKEEVTGKIKEQTTTEEDSIPTINIVIENEKVKNYNLEITKIKKTTESTISNDELIAKAETELQNTEIEYLQGARFKLFKGTEEIGEYTTDETGKITINNLYQSEEEKGTKQIYTLREIEAPKGYIETKDIKFEVAEKEGTLVLTQINEKGEKQEGENYTVEGNTIKLTVENSPTFKLIKKDKETQTLIPNVKFAIYNVDNGIEELAKNSKGETIGTKEIINGIEYYTLTTNENGEIDADLAEGLYKIVEIQAPDQYDIEGEEFYFGIGESRKLDNNKLNNPVVIDSEIIEGPGIEEIKSVAQSEDGGYVAGGSFSSPSIKIGDYTITNIDSESQNGIIIKYNKEGEIEWAKAVAEGTNNFFSIEITSVALTKDGEIIAGGFFAGDIQIGNYTLTNNINYYNGLIIKYNKEGEVEWAEGIEGNRDNQINSVATSEDGGFIAGGYFNSSSIQVGDYTLTNNNSYNNGLIIKYNKEGEVEWAKGIEGNRDNEINSVATSEDGGFIAGGYFSSSSIQVGDYTLTNNNRYSNGLIIKYNKEGEVEWAKGLFSSNIRRWRIHSRRVF